MFFSIRHSVNILVQSAETEWSAFSLLHLHLLVPPGCSSPSDTLSTSSSASPWCFSSCSALSLSSSSTLTSFALALQDQTFSYILLWISVSQAFPGDGPALVPHHWCFCTSE